MIERYSRPEMARIWTDENRFRTWLRIELLACEAMARLGDVPESDWKECVERAPDVDAAAVEQIAEIEQTTRHDVIAFLTWVERSIGPAARWLHLGMTSSDILDTGLAVLLGQAGEVLIDDLDFLLSVLERRAHEHEHTLMVGRTHGIHAEPITFGLKLASWYDEFRRHRVRLKGALSRVAVGKLSGAVGTFAHLSPTVEAHVCRELGLGVEPAASQVVHRDRHAELTAVLAGVGASVERIAVEIRHLQRTEVGEVEEAFGAGQKGSSAMPHKRNPILSENLTGLSRLLRGYSVSAFENVALWHERDISHSSVERVILPDATIVLDFALVRLRGLLDGLVVNQERMLENLESSKGLVFSQALLLDLARRGVARQDAYVMVQRNAMRAWKEGLHFKDVCLADEEIVSLLGREGLEGVFDLSRYLASVGVIFSR
ncbi:MAG: adenylosuccinate lyase, partial [Myxococcota bacterium]